MSELRPLIVFDLQPTMCTRFGSLREIVGTLVGQELGRTRARFLLSSCLFGVIQILSGCTTGTYTSVVPATITPSNAVLLPGQTLQFTATGNSLSLANPTWMVNGVPGGSPTTGTITSSGLYTAPTSPSVMTVQVTEGNLIQGVKSAPSQVSLFSLDKFEAGTVSSSNNPQVGLYTFRAPQGASVQIQFGTSTNYGLTTWAQEAPVGGGTVSILVAGMRASTTYHMQAVVQLPNGQRVVDADHVFTTGDLPAELAPNITVPQAAEAGAAPGVELLDLVTTQQNELVALATDLVGNVIWYYKLDPGEIPHAVKPLPNGHMLVLSFGATNEVREIDLAGNVVNRLSITDVAQGLSAIGASFQALESLHHDILELPNGHLILLANYTQTFTDQPGFSTVTGDALVDWDPQEKSPVWTWSTFDHIPLTHAPLSKIDWTHANAVIYSPDDGNLILSMRHQNWIVKINYQNGAGDGRILWRLGPDGDFSLPSGQAPMEWNYAQHYPTVLGPNSAGIFHLMFFNNGNYRLLDTANHVCGTAEFAQCYSSVPIFEVNEYANTARVLWEYNLSPHYSLCCGNASVLANGDIEYDVALDVNTPNQSYIQEVTQTQAPQLVWQLNITGQIMYRGFRIPSLYPGVVWTQSAIATANANATVQAGRKAALKLMKRWDE
jgi:arylsulfate sulfotransferase